MVPVVITDEGVEREVLDIIRQVPQMGRTPCRVHGNGIQYVRYNEGENVAVNEYPFSSPSTLSIHAGGVKEEGSELTRGRSTAKVERCRDDVFLPLPSPALLVTVPMVEGGSVG